MNVRCRIGAYSMERREEIWGIAIAVFVGCILLFYPLILGNSDTADDGFSPAHTFGYSIIVFIPNFLVGSVKRCSSKRFERSMQRHKIKSKRTKISIFTGRGANKNQAIFEILDAKGPLPISELQKMLNKQKSPIIRLRATPIFPLNSFIDMCNRIYRNKFCWLVQK